MLQSFFSIKKVQMGHYNLLKTVVALEYVQNTPTNPLHSIKPILCYEEEVPISYEIDLKFNKIRFFLNRKF